jgi:glycosyltransferase involved in cell wall biosynthesis
MKLLIINSEFPPIGAGAGNASANIARELVLAGHEVVVVTAAHAGLPGEEVVDGVRVLRGPASRSRVDRSTALEQVVFILGATTRCFALLRTYRPDSVLAFFGLPSGGVAWLLRLVFRIPYVVSLRGGDVPGFRPYDFWLYHRLAVPFLRAIWRGAGAVVANSQGLRQLALSFDPKTEIEVVPNGVETPRYWKEDRNWAGPRLLSVGRIVHQKGLDLAMEALSGLKDIAWDWRIAGDGPQLAGLREALQREKMEGCVHLLGWTTPEALIHEYRSASVFVFPSRHEGMPNAVLEAMASGLPVIASRIAGNEELVIDGETGRLVPAGDAEALRASLRELLGDESQRERMGRAAHRRAAEKYGWTATANRYLEILQEVRR